MEIKLAGFKYSKIAVEREENLPKDFQLKIKPNINIKTIEKFKPEASKQESLKVVFNFEVEYTDLGKVALEGIMYLLTDSKTIKDTVKGWEDKKLDKEIQLIILNIIMQKASIKAFELEEDLNLPPHVQLPRLEVSEKK